MKVFYLGFPNWLPYRPTCLGLGLHLKIPSICNCGLYLLLPLLRRGNLSVPWNFTVCPDQLILFMGTVLFKIRKNGRFKMCFATMSTTPKNCDNKSNRLQTHCTPPNVPKHSASKCLATPLWPTFTIMSILALVFVINLVCRRQHKCELHFAVDLPKFGSISS